MTVNFSNVTLYMSPGPELPPECVQHLLRGPDMHQDGVYEGVVSVSCQMDELRDLCQKWTSGISLNDMEAIRCLMAKGAGVPSPGQLMHSQNLKQVVDSLNGQWLDGLLAADRLVTFFQPIVRMNRPRQVFAYECLVRGQDENGRLIFPDQLFAAARATGKIALLDHAARIKAIRTVEQRKLKTRIFININPRFLQESFDLLKTTIRAVVDSGLPPTQYIFEVVESDEIDDLPKLMQIIDFCREAGCRVALDDIGAGYNSLNLMSNVRPDYIKIDRELIREVDVDLYKSCVAAKLVELARELDIKTIVEGIETEGEWRWAVAQHADYGQGYFFARPAADPPPSCPVIVASEAGPPADGNPNLCDF